MPLVNTRLGGDIWTEIRDLAFCVILLTQREDGLWSLPVSKADFHSYAPPNTLERKIREHGDFGSGSITVSCNALIVLSKLTGEGVPKATPDVIRWIEAHRSPRGGYGSFSPGKDGSQINAIPRHTAAAVVTRLLFPISARDPEIAARMTESVQWLLDNRERRGGWSHSSNTKPDLGFLSTASSLCALSLYLELDIATKRLSASIKSALSSGYSALAAARRDGVWHGDGVPPAFEALDSAFALRLLRIADRSRVLSSCCINESAPISALIADYSKRVAHPEAQFQSSDLKALTYISALQLISESGDPGGVGDEALRSMEESVLLAWRGGDLVRSMTGWDWQCLGMLASTKAGPLAPSATRRLEEECQAIRSEWLAGDLTRKSISGLDRRIIPPVTFALSRGRGLRPPWKIYAGSLPGVIANMALENVVKAVLAVGLALALMAISLFLWSDSSTLSELWKRWFP